MKLSVGYDDRRDSNKHLMGVKGLVKVQKANYLALCAVCDILIGRCLFHNCIASRYALSAPWFYL